MSILELLPNHGGKVLGDYVDYSKIHNIERISGPELNYDDFFWKYMKMNRPVILTDIANDWSCSKHWVKDGKVDLNYLAEVIGNTTVPVANCSKVYFNSHDKIELSFNEYIKYWNTRNKTSEILYLKDWHLKATKSNYDFYTVPNFYASDWLNEYLIDTNKDDYRFVYIGPKDSWTPFHADVFSSFSWSANIVGTKKWLLLPPGEELKLKDRLGNDPFSINEQLLDEKDARYFTILQEANESIFVPSKWFHQVWNVTDTISVNHNWFNGCNIHRIWTSFSENFPNVVHEIADCKDMENFQEHCQVMMKSIFGINISELLDILEHVIKKRLGSELNIMFDSFQLNAYHKNYDLEQVYSVLKKILKDESIEGACDIRGRCKNLCDTINEFQIKMTE